MHIFTNPNCNFLRWRWHALVLSWLVILAGIFVIATQGIPKGVEFAGGTVVITKFDQHVSTQQVRAALEKSFAGGGENLIIQEYDLPSTNQVMIRVPQVGAESGMSLST